MKKIAKMLGALAVLACGFVFSGCENTLDDLVGPKDVWCNKVFEYESGEEVSKVRCYFYYATKSTTMRLGNENTTIEPGLTIAAVSVKSDGSILATLGENTFAITTLKEGVSYNSEGAEDSSGSFSIKSSLWTGICVLNPSIPGTKSSAIPEYLQDRTKFDGTFDWSKITKQFLAQKLLDSLD